MKPNFLFIGPDKSGSTWLYNALAQHEQVYVPKAKELFFFDQFYEYGWNWYSNYFAQASHLHSVVGEISHDYLFSPLACERIARDIPDVKLMVCLREPAQRAFSAYLYMVKQGRVTSDFDTAIRNIDELIDHGLYAKHLGHYLTRFKRNQIHVSVFDNLTIDPQVVFDDICDFLDIEHMLLPAELKKKRLPAARPRFRYGASVARKIGWKIRCMGLPELVGRVKRFSLLARMNYH